MSDTKPTFNKYVDDLLDWYEIIARIKYGMLTKEEFKKWNMKAVSQTQLFDDGKLSFEEFKEWFGNK